MTVSINFLIIATVLFFVVKAMNRLKEREDAKVDTASAAPEVPANVKLLSEIRDILSNGSVPQR